jgi:hypothetical protein
LIHRFGGILGILEMRSFENLVHPGSEASVGIQRR